MDGLRERLASVFDHDGGILQWAYDYDLADDADITALVGSVLAEIEKDHVIVERSRLDRLLVEPTLEVEAVCETEGVSRDEALRMLGWEPGDLGPLEPD